MKHVFVETNFLINAARPFPALDARRFLDRAKAGELALHVPWVSVNEAKRTLRRAVHEDLGFTDKLVQFAKREFLDGNLTRAEKQVLDDVAQKAKSARVAASTGISVAIDTIVAAMNVIEPTKDVVQKTLGLFPVKSQKPFDEMALGAVLAKAAELFGSGEKDLWFCSLDKKDFSPSNQPALSAEYSACGLTFLPSFQVP